MRSGQHYDLISIGSGPAGREAALHAAYFGKRVAIIERDERAGGSPVYRTGVPTKTIREAARYLTGFRDRDVYGVGLSLQPDITLERLARRTSDVTRALSGSINETLRRFGIQLIHGSARLQGGGAVLATTEEWQQELTADVILIATGSRPRLPAGVPDHDPRVIDSETVFNITRLPERIVIAGGGAVGCEYASIFNALGTQVTLVEAAGRLLPFMDREITEKFAETLESHGIRLRLNTAVSSVESTGGRPRVSLSDGEVVEPDFLMFAAGRQANTEGLGLDEAGVRTRENGYIEVDQHFRTTAERVYAAGDVTGPPGLASVAGEQGRVAASDAFGLGVLEQADAMPPFGVYAIPEVAMIGMTEDEARAEGVDYLVGRGLFSGNPRAWIAGSTEGMVKLVFRRSDRVVIGVHIMTDDAADLVHLGQALVRLRLPLDYLIETTFNAPTFTEAYKSAAYDGLTKLRPGAGQAAGAARQGAARR